jgi:hypothetical protein
MKNISKFILLISVAIFAVVSFNYINKSGFFEKYPDAVYMDENSAAGRIAYSQLNNKEKSVYTALYNGIRLHKENVALPYEISGDEYDKLYCLIEKQESDLFYISSSYKSAVRIRNAQIIYNADKNDLKSLQGELEEKSDSILASLTSDMSDYEKLLYLHDYLVKNCVYKVDDEPFSGTAYGCIVQGSARCEGYAKALDYLLKKTGIACDVVIGTTYTGENHAWNQVRIDGQWYNCDVTWDDTDDQYNGRHSYMMCNDLRFDKSHIADKSYFTPMVCSSTDSYFTHQNLYISTLDDADTILINELSTLVVGDSFELMMADDNEYKQFKETYIDGERLFTILIENSRSGSEGEKISFNLMENEENNTMLIGLVE